MLGIKDLNKLPTFILILVMLGLNVACTHHAVPPPVPTPGPLVQSNFSDKTWKLSPLEFSGKSIKDSPRHIQALGDRFKDYLKSKLALGAETRSPDLTFKLELTVERNHYRTIIMDMINIPFIPFLVGGFFNPEWGNVQVGAQLKLYDQDNNLLGRHITHAREDFSMIIYSWYRGGPIEDAFEKSYATVFNRLIEQMVKKDLAYAPSKSKARPELGLAGLLNDPSTIDPFLQNAPVKQRPPKVTRQLPTKVELPVSPVAETWTEIPTTEAEPVPENKDRFRIIYEPDPIVYESYLMRGLQALGGFEGAYFTGEASVTSSVTREDGTSTEVANGRAKHRGYRITLYDVPETTGFYWYPVIGFLDQSIDITDFNQDVPTLGATVGTDIGADCTLLDEDIQTPINCDQTNTYSLDMQSVVAGLRMGFSVVAGTPSAQVFFTGTAGSNLMEWRSITASLGERDQGKRNKVEFIQSAALGSTLGLFFPKLRFSIRGMFNYEVYQSFKFDEPIEFMGPTVCDFEIGRCERERAFVESTSLSSWTMQVAAGVSF
jgi:hypothetical protein